jgi:AcrR family transcriptional regulator
MTPTMARPGGRSAKVTEAVHGAVVELLTAGEPVTIPAVASRAGVNATSVYRRWGDVSGLLSDTALVRFGTSADVPDTGALREDLLAWGAALVEESSRPAELALLRAAVAAEPVDPGAPQGFESACSACLVGRSSQAEAILDAAAARGEDVPTPTRVLDHLVAPIYFRALFGLPAPSVEVLVELLLERLIPPTRAQAAPSGLG